MTARGIAVHGFYVETATLARASHRRPLAVSPRIIPHSSDNCVLARSCGHIRDGA